MDTERNPTEAPTEFRLPLTVAVSEKGGHWPPPPTLWERFLKFLRSRRS